jgi:hypothetical protein
MALLKAAHCRFLMFHRLRNTLAACTLVLTLEYPVLDSPQHVIEKITIERCSPDYLTIVRQFFMDEKPVGTFSREFIPIPASPQ